MPTGPHEFTTQDVAYLRHGDRALMARLLIPRSDGPFAAVVDLHGGAWTGGDLAECKDRDAALARSGFVVAALNFRHAGDGYPTSLADINYGIRWLKAQAREFHVDPGRIGICGQSSGGHLAMLAAMRPNDPRYAAVPLHEAAAAGLDASVRCVAMAWPVINPLSRYRYARRLRDSAEPPAWAVPMPEKHELYWKSEANMAEGNPMLALERAEAVLTPPALWVQGRPDNIHDYRDPDSPIPGNEPERFAANYRKAGGEIEVRYIDQAARATAASFEPIAAFFRKHLD
ncbi:MAG TPA: alpha/beta hydrolase [Acetobacteraceae bacterium]|nr:alpha/beta hydrolase [Acetobacteraceae bacterium]